jgi:hypothetical protein
MFVEKRMQFSRTYLMGPEMALKQKYKARRLFHLLRHHGANVCYPGTQRGAVFRCSDDCQSITTPRYQFVRHRQLLPMTAGGPQVFGFT